MRGWGEEPDKVQCRKDSVKIKEGQEVGGWGGGGEGGWCRIKVK